jgi:O-antigen ligase
MVRWYYLASAIYLLIELQAFSIFDRLAYGEWEGKAGDKFTTVLNLVWIVASLALFVWGLRRTKGISTGGALLLAAAGYLLLSTLWSIDGSTTLRRGMLYLFSVVGAVGVASSLDVDEFMDALGLTCAISAVASLLLLVIAPGAASISMGASSDFRGIFSHKNMLGQAMVAGAFATLYSIRVGGRRRRGNVVMLVLFAVVAALSKSTTSFMTIFSFCAADGIIVFIRKGGASRIMAIGAVVLLLPAVAFGALFPDSILELLGKDPTLTGRTDLWAYVIADIAQKPWLGWGYSAFWSPNDPAAAEISDILKWYVPQAHNGILEMLLNAGIIGTAFFLFLWVRNLQIAAKCLRTPKIALAISTCFACGGLFLIGISESVLMEPFQIITTMFFVTGLMSERAIQAARRRSHAPRFASARK